MCNHGRQNFIVKDKEWPWYEFKCTVCGATYTVDGRECSFTEPGTPWPRLMRDRLRKEKEEKKEEGEAS